MRKLLLGTALSLILVASANAADLYTKAPPATYNWTGLYVGGNVGYGWGTGGDSTVFETAAGVVVGAPTNLSTNVTGFVGGGQIGYNWQISSVVLGIEGDLDYLDQTGTSTFTNVLGTGTNNLRENYISTVRGRLGYAADRWLFYVTGGAAFVGFTGSSSFDFIGSPTSVPITSATGNRPGYAVGGGVDMALSHNWTLGVEYLYVNTGSVTDHYPTGPFFATTLGLPILADTHDFEDNIVRAHLNFKF